VGGGESRKTRGYEKKENQKAHSETHGEEEKKNLQFNGAKKKVIHEKRPEKEVRGKQNQNFVFSKATGGKGIGPTEMQKKKVAKRD